MPKTSTLKLLGVSIVKRMKGNTVRTILQPIRQANKTNKDTFVLLTDLERMIRYRKPAEGEDPRLSRQQLLRAQRALQALRRAIQGGQANAALVQDLRAVSNNLHINHPHHFQEVLEKLERSYPFRA